MLVRERGDWYDPLKGTGTAGEEGADEGPLEELKKRDRTLFSIASDDGLAETGLPSDAQAF